MGELSKIKNIGKELEKQLNEVGINSFDELKKNGSRNALLKILQTMEIKHWEQGLYAFSAQRMFA